MIKTTFEILSIEQPIFHIKNEIIGIVLRARKGWPYLRPISLRGPTQFEGLKINLP